MTSSPSNVPDLPTVSSLLSGLDRPAFGRFVTDLWTLRNRDARFVDGVVRVADGEAERVIVLSHGRWHPTGGVSTDLPPDVDPTDVVAVVSSAPDDSRARTLADRSNARLVGPADLRRMALYAIDRDACDTLFRRYFDAGLDDLDTPSGSTESLRVRLTSTRPTVLAGGSASALVVLTLVALSITVPASLGLTGPGEPSVATPARLSTPPPTPTATVTPVSTVDTSLGCHPTPRAATEAQLAALRANDPETNDGIRRVWEGATVEFRRYTDSFETFVQILNNYPFVGLLDPETVEYGELTRTGRIASQTLSLTTTEGDQYVYTITLVREDADAEGCWTLTGLTYRSQGGQTASPRSPTADTSPQSDANEPTSDGSLDSISRTFK